MGNYFTVLEDKDRRWSVSEEKYARENLIKLTIMTDETLTMMNAFVPPINEDPCKKKEQKPL